MKWIAVLLVLMLMPQAWSLHAYQEIVLMEDEMAISIRIPGQAERNVTLTWPIHKDEVLTLPQSRPEVAFEFDASDSLVVAMRPVPGRQVETLFKIRYDQVLGKHIIFPVPKCLGEEVAVSLDVLLPPGLVASDCSPTCTKFYDHDAKSMRLSWARLDERGCRVILVEPGKGQDGLAAEVRRILLRSLLFWTIALLFSGLAVFAAFRLIRPPR